MTFDTIINKVWRVVLDTNVLISAIEFGGICETIYLQTLKNKIRGITSVILIDELEQTLKTKFGYSPEQINFISSTIQKHFELVTPIVTLELLRDKDDNRVLEAAVAGGCSFIVTGDKDLLSLGIYKSIKILTPRQFLDQLSHT